MTLKVIIADDYFLIREGIKKSLQTLKDVTIVGETSDIDEFVVLVAQHTPNIAIIEINLCDRPIQELIAQLKQESPCTKVLIISDCYCEIPVIMSIRAGISGFIRKNVSQEEIVQAIRSIANGVDYFTPEITQLLINGYLSNASKQSSFSERELEIFRYICKGRSNEQIADILFISEKTVATHRKNIMKKAGVKKTSDLILWALEKNLFRR